MNKIDYSFIRSHLSPDPNTWLVTGCAGFIGSHLTEALLQADQKVIGLDNFSTGKASNLTSVKSSLNRAQLGNFTFLEGDLRDQDFLRRNIAGADYCLHQAAMGSVPRSILEPCLYHENNVTGFINLLEVCRFKNIKKIVYASSSSVYGDSPDNPKCEKSTGTPLSPYALTKQINEMHAALYSQLYGVNCIGLRYFNVFGPRQDPEGDYAAVIPRWIDRLGSGKQCEIYGDGETSRDFCFITNVVFANILAATKSGVGHRVYNVGHGEQTSLNDLHAHLVAVLESSSKGIAQRVPTYLNFRPGDIRHSLSNIDRISNELGFHLVTDLHKGLAITVSSFCA